MDATDLITVFRNSVDDYTEPYFWTDALLYIYLTDAVNMYCKYGRGIRDHTSELTLVDYTANDPWVPLDKKIIKLISAYDNTTGRKLTITDWETFQSKGSMNTTDYGSSFSAATYPDSTGIVHTLITSMDDNALRLVNIPSTGGTIKMVIERYPLKGISANNLEFEGIQTGDELSLLEWVKFRAYSHQDAEMFDPDKAALSRAAFMLDMEKVDSQDLIKTHRPFTTSYGGL